MASILAYRGNYREAISFFQRALQIGPETSTLYLGLGQTYRWANLPRQAADAYQKGVILAQGELAQNSRDSIVQAHLAYMWARLDDRRQAESEAVLALQATPRPIEADRWVVMTYEALGDHEHALAAAEAAPDEALRRLKRSPDMAGLRANPRFQQLMESRHIQ